MQQLKYGEFYCDGYSVSMVWFNRNRIIVNMRYDYSCFDGVGCIGVKGWQAILKMIICVWTVWWNERKHRQ